MPRFDLRQKDGTVHPLAPFKVLAVMCHPTNRIQREKMLGNIEQETGVSRPRRHPMTADEFMQEVRLTSRRAVVAGGLLLTMLQLHHNGHQPSLNQAMPLVASLLPEWQQPQSPSWSKTSHYEHRPHSRTNMLRALNHFRPVAHLWAAMAYGEHTGRRDIWPGALETLPTFLGYGKAILRLVSPLPSLARNRRFAVTSSEAWSFTLGQPIATVKLTVPPLSAEQLAILNEYQAGKHLG
jgi:hypothetical protein